jgi:hypothetical protein
MQGRIEKVGSFANALADNPISAKLKPDTPRA